MKQAFRRVFSRALRGATGTCAEIAPCVAMGLAAFGSAVAASETATQGVCGRTPAVAAAIAAANGEDCADIGAGELHRVLSLDLSGRSLGSLAAGDFAGLERLRRLDLSGNALTSLPEGVFDDLGVLETLRLAGNGLTSLPEGVFDRLLALRELTLHGNALATLPDGVFDELLLLETLTLHGNGLGSLPDTAGLFDAFSPFWGLPLDGPGDPPRGAEALRRFVAEAGIDSVEDFVAALPPSHRKNFVMVYDSHGLGSEFVSREHPRMISWGADGRFLFAWTTDPDATAPFGTGVEFLISAGTKWDAGVVDFSGEAPAIVRPEVCASCHGELLKPLWSSDAWNKDDPADVPEAEYEGTEEHAWRDADVWSATSALMSSENPRIAPMDFAASTLAADDARRLRPFATVAEEFAAAVGRRHAEVLFAHVLAQDARDEGDRLRRLECMKTSPYSTVFLRKARVGGGPDWQPSFVPALGADIGFIHPSRLWTYFHFGSTGHAFRLGAYRHWWRNDEVLRARFAETSNRHLNDERGHSGFTGQLPDTRFYAPGTASMEDELIRAFRQSFGHRSSLNVEAGETAHRPAGRSRQAQDGHVLVDGYSLPAYRTLVGGMEAELCDASHLRAAHATMTAASELRENGRIDVEVRYPSHIPPRQLRSSEARVHVTNGHATVKRLIEAPPPHPQNTAFGYFLRITPDTGTEWVGVEVPPWTHRAPGRMLPGGSWRLSTATGEVLPSADASLRGLAVAGAAGGWFDPARTSYALRVPHALDVTTVAPAKSHFGATYGISPDDADPDRFGHQVAVAEGAATVVEVAVTAEDGETTRTYTVTVTRAGSPDATLGSLSLSGIDLGPFDPARLTYSAVTELSSLTVAAAAAGAGATVSVPGGTRDADGNWPVPLAEGDNEIAVTVTAQDGTTRTYTVTVRRAPAGTATCRNGTALADPEHNPGLVRDCETLLSLKGELDPTGDMNWGDQPGFRRLDLGEWDTVAVRDGRVREIAWDGTDSSISLRGVLPAALGELDALEVLRLDSHGLHGGLPETLRRLSRLEVLDLGYNWRMDEEPLPAWLGELTSLRRVRLHAHAPGTVPDSWSSLTRLEDLELYAPTGAPGAAGPVASWLGDLPALRRLVLRQRRSTGRIPLSLAREFDELDLRMNALAGCVPAQLAESENARASEQGLGAGRYRLPACALSVDAGAGGEVSAGATAELSATAAGHHGDATLVWSWTQESGPSVALTDAGTATPSFAVPARGAADAEFAFSVTVHDAEATSGRATATVTHRLPGFAGTASPAVSGPVSHAVVEGDTAVATLAATDADTAAARLSWRLSGGSDASHFALGGSGSLSFVSAKDYEAPDDADGDGTYAVSVEVSDGLRSATADLTVALVNRNEAPTAEAGPDQSDVSAGATVTLSGSATDPDAGDALTHAWTQVSGASVELSSPGSASATFAAPASGGALTFRLRATDAGGLWGEDEVTVSVRTEAASPIAGFTLVNGDDGADIGALRDGDELAAGLGALEIRADLGAGESVGSVHFALGGAKTVERTENLAPYELFGGQGGETFGAGSYTLTATPYAERGLGGAAGVAATVSFTVSAPKASVDRDRLVLTWRTPRDAFAAPRGSDFAVTVDGAFRPVAAASVSGNGVLLTLSAPVAPGQSVRVDYLGSAMHPLADARGAEVGTWTDLPAENVTGRPDADMHGWVAGRHGAAGRSPPPWPAADSAVTSLSLASAGLADGDLARLGALAGLERLDLSGNGLTDLAALAGLARLRSLDLSDNEVSDLWPLAALTGLRRLDVSGNRVSDLSPLSELPRLEVLVADANLVTDAGALTHLVRLENLGLADNAVSDLAPLADLASLRRLDLGGNPAADASPLGDLGTLVWLRLPATAEAPAGRLARLRWLRRADGDGARAAPPGAGAGR